MRRMKGCRHQSSIVQRAPDGVRFVRKTGAGTGPRLPSRPKLASSDRRTAMTAPEADSAKAILDLLELELGGMIRQLERAANSVAGGAEATAATLSTIRERTDALSGRTSAAQATATTFAQAAEKFTQSAAGDRRPGARRRQARRPGQRRRQRSQRQCRPAPRILGRDRQCRQPDRADRAADHAAGAQLHHRGGARRRGRPRLCGGRHRSQGAGGADPERHRGDHQEDRGAAERRRRLGGCRAPHLAGDRGDPPGIRQRQRRGGRAEPDHRRDVRQRRLRLAASSSRSATAPPRSTAPPRKPRPMAKASPRPARPSPLFAQKLKSRCAVLLRQSERRRAPQRERLPCQLKIEITGAARRHHRARSTRFPAKAS